MQTEIPNSTKPSKSSHQSVDRPDQSAGKRKYPRWETFKRRPDYRLVSAGGVVYRNRSGRIEVFFIKDSFGRWSFPKGKIELGETLAQTAVREIREETGLEGLRLVASLGKTSFRFWREAGLIEKTVHLFLFKAPANVKAKLAKEEAIRGAAWMPVHCAFQVSGYRNSDKLLGEAMRKIAETEGITMEIPTERKRAKPGVRRRLSHSNPRKEHDAGTGEGQGGTGGKDRGGGDAPSNRHVRVHY
jgi:8-oxo-dGTP pyrophosphatase MutT (NUDIX family)